MVAFSFCCETAVPNAKLTFKSIVGAYHRSCGKNGVDLFGRDLERNYKDPLKTFKIPGNLPGIDEY